MVDTAQFDTLFTLAEMAVAMFSVAGLIAVFLTKGTLQPTDRIRFLMIVIAGIMLAVFGFVPVWVARHASSDSITKISELYDAQNVLNQNLCPLNQLLVTKCPSKI